MELESCKVLVTGGDGYVGQYVVSELVNYGAQVTAFSNIPYSSSRLTSVQTLCGDIRDLGQVSQAIAGNDVVVHLACLPVSLSFANPIMDFEVNALGTVNVLIASHNHRVQRVVYTSTSEVYGLPRYRPIDETHPADPLSPYGTSKLCGEIYCRSFDRVYGLKSIILRFFNIYGEAADGRARSTVDAIFLRRVLAGKPPIIQGNPQHARDFVHVKDAARSVRLAITSDTALGQTINIASGVATTLEELARLTIELMGSTMEPVVEGSVEEPVVFQAQITRAQKLLKYVPSIDLRAGLSEMIKRTTGND